MRPALYLSVGALLQVVGAQALPVAGREVQVRERVGLGLLEYSRGLRAAALKHLYGQVVGRPHGAGLPEAEHGRHDPGDAARRAPGARRGPRAVSHEVDGAPLPGGALEGLLDRAPEALVGVGGDEPRVPYAPLPDPAEERRPRVVALGADDAHAQHVPPSLRVAAYRGGHGRRRHAPGAAALHVGGGEPQVGRGEVSRRPGEELLDLRVEALAYGADLVLRNPLDAHGRGHPLHLPGAGAGRVHLGHGRHDGPVDALVALEHVLGEEAPRAQLRYPERQRAHARREHALAIAVPAVARGLAGLVGLGAHDLVDDGLGQLPEHLLQVDRAVLEAGHPRGGAHRRLCYAARCGHCLSLEPVLSRFQILGNGRFP